MISSKDRLERAMGNAAELYALPGGEWSPSWTVIPPDAEQLEVIARIEREFAEDGPNRGQTWIQGEMLDNHEPEAILAQGANIGRYARWQEVPDVLFARYPSAVHFIDLPGFRFHLPALMRWVLRWGLHWSAPAYDTVGERALHPLLAPTFSTSQRSLVETWNIAQLPDHLRFRKK